MERVAAVGTAVTFGKGAQVLPTYSPVPQNLACGHTSHPSFTLLPVPLIGQTQLAARGKRSWVDLERQVEAV